MARALEADACFVYSYDPPADALHLEAVHGARLDPSAPRPRLRPGEGLTGVAAAQRQPVAVAAAARHDPRFRPFPGLDEDRLESLLAVPILDRAGQLLGAMNVRTTRPRTWQPDEVALLETIAMQVAQAIANARLYERSQRRVEELEALARISAAVSGSLYNAETLAEIVETARAASRADTCALVLRGADGLHVAQRSGAEGADDEVVLQIASRAPYDAGGTLAVALVFRARDVGALVAVRASPFTVEERALLGTIAHHAAIAAESGRGIMRGLLAQEVHHRVKNNLQMVASLLRLRAGGADARHALDDSVERVLAIAEVHDLLTTSREGEVDLADLVGRLATKLRRGIGTSVTQPELVPLDVPGEVATAVALIFCELYANAMEHGGGDVDVSLVPVNGHVELIVRDRGPGLPHDFDPKRSLGLTIATALADEDLGGHLALETAAPGTRAVVRWPAP